MKNRRRVGVFPALLLSFFYKNILLKSATARSTENKEDGMDNLILPYKG